MAAKWAASKSGLEKSTQPTYSNVMDDHVLPRWKTIPLAAVEFEDVQAWIAELVASGLSGAHVRKIYFVLAGVLQLAVKGKRLPANPAKGVDLPRAKSKDKKYFDVQQVEAMAAAAGAVARNAPRRGSSAGRDQYWLAVYVLAYCAGCVGRRSLRCASIQSICFGVGCMSRRPWWKLITTAWMAPMRPGGPSGGPTLDS
jgi:site-specific recombinase XerD